MTRFVVAEGPELGRFANVWPTRWVNVDAIEVAEIRPAMSGPEARGFELVAYVRGSLHVLMRGAHPEPLAAWWGDVLTEVRAR